MRQTAGMAIPDVDTAVATRERLIQVAMQLFGERGIDRVSLKEISDAAGNRNKSAVGYHFTNKQGLIDALLHRIERDVGVPIGDALAAIEASLDAGEPVAVADVVRAAFAPVRSFYMTSPYGRDAFRLLAGLMHHPVGGLPAALRQASDVKLDRALRILQRLQPAKSLRLVEQHLHHTTMATINGLSLMHCYIALRTDRWGPDDLGAFFDASEAILSAGLKSDETRTNIAKGPVT